MEALLSVKPIERLVGIQRQAIGYFNHSISYDVQNTMKALDGTGGPMSPTCLLFTDAYRIFSPEQAHLYEGSMIPLREAVFHFDAGPLAR